MSIEEVEKLRKKSRNIFLCGLTISGLTAIISLFINSIAPIFVFVIGLILTIIINIKPKKEFNMAYKDMFVLNSLKSVFTDLVYEPDEGLDESVIRSTNMMDMGDRYSSNDFISGKYKNINFSQADVHIEERRTTTDSNGNQTTSTVTLFRGRWLIFDFNKSFKANIQVREKKFHNAKISNFFSEKKYEKISLEDQAFNNEFVVYAQDSHEAFYILTPALMSKIKNLSNSISGTLLFCFVDSKLHIGLNNNKDSFERGVFSKINEEEETKNISNDIKVITDFVDQLNLDNDLFK